MESDCPVPSIGEYLESLLLKPNQSPPLSNAPQDEANFKEITLAEIDQAVSKLGKNKAPGVDQLTDSILRTGYQELTVQKKIARIFTHWLDGDNIPQYLKCAKVITLSKTDSPCPPVGQIRPIAILPTLYKLFETVVHDRILSSMEELNLNLHPA